MSNDVKESTRLNKAISDTGFCSRREADKYIEQGVVTINGKPCGLGVRVFPGDEVKVNGASLPKLEKTVYIAFNKPVGITCTTELKIKGNIIDYIRHPQRIFPVGRLDKDSEGLIFLTSDGNIVNKILRVGNHHEKEYLVTVNKPITSAFIHKMGNGIPILDTITSRCFVKKESNYVFRIILTQGLNRQIRRMCSYLDYDVLKLKRIRIMNIKLDAIPIGKWRDFTSTELEAMHQMIANSIKTEEASVIANTSKNPF